MRHALAGIRTTTIVLLLWSGLPLSGQEEQRWVVIEERPGAGEQCLVCRQAVHGESVAEVRYKGRTFHVKEAMLEAFAASPDDYFRELEVRGALFDERSLGGALAGGWLWLGIYVLAGLVFGALCGFLAVSKALPPVPWFFAGLAGNVVALGVLLIRPPGDVGALPSGIPPGLAKVPVTRTPLPCPTCGAPNHPSAFRCSGCNAALSPSVAAETSKI